MVEEILVSNRTIGKKNEALTLMSNDNYKIII